MTIWMQHMPCCAILGPESADKELVAVKKLQPNQYDGNIPTFTVSTAMTGRSSFLRTFQIEVFEA